MKKSNYHFMNQIQEIVKTYLQGAAHLAALIGMSTKELTNLLIYYLANQAFNICESFESASIQLDHTGKTVRQHMKKPPDEMAKTKLEIALSTIDEMPRIGFTKDQFDVRYREKYGETTGKELKSDQDIAKSILQILKRFEIVKEIEKNKFVRLEDKSEYLVKLQKILDSLADQAIIFIGSTNLKVRELGIRGLKESPTFHGRFRFKIKESDILKLKKKGHDAMFRVADAFERKAKKDLQEGYYIYKLQISGLPVGEKTLSRKERIALKEPTEPSKKMKTGGLKHEIQKGHK